MFMTDQGGFRAAMMAGVSHIPAGSLETKDGDVTPAEIKGLVDEMAKTITAFRTKNDERLAQVEKKGEDAVTKDEVEKLNKGIDALKDEMNKQLDEIQAKTNRLSLNGAAETAIEAKNAKAFGNLIGKKDYSPENLAEYKADLDTYLRRSEVKGTTMQVASDPSGGFWVTPDVTGRMVKKIYETSPMRQICNVVTIGTDALEGPIDNGEMDAQWIGEVPSRPQTTTAEVGVWRIPVNELYAYPWVTQKLLEDSMIDVEAWISMKAADKFGRKENAAFVAGSGSNQPMGLLTYDFVTTDDSTRAWGNFQYVPTGVAGAFPASSASVSQADPIITLMGELKSGYRPNANFLAARRALAAIRKLKDGQGNYIVDLRLRDSNLVESIFGTPVVDGEDMPNIAANSLSLLYGDFNEAYTIVDRLGMSAVRDNITRPGFVKYHMRKRVGGGAVNFEAVKALKFSAT
jgi:HK97 family phage major capsid protein